MKELKKPKWKLRKRGSFRLYFTIFVSVIICMSVAIAFTFSELARDWLTESLRIPQFITLILGSLIIGAVLSHFVGKFTLAPIKRIRNAMREVSEGNLDVAISEESRFDEIEDICHAFNIMTKELRSTQIIQKDFIANVSHEFKTPLTAIEGYTTMLQDSSLTEEERKEYTEKILFNANRMNELVTNILLISKLENQGINSKNEDFSIDEQIRQEILATEIKWTKKNIDFDVNLEPIFYKGNGDLIAHVWSNLLDNAIKFSPINGKIKLELKMWNGYVYFSVSDEGEGIEEKAKEKLFDKFYQGDTSHKQEGNGLGLALVKRIVDMYGGEIEAQNLSPKGCQFIVRLPIE